MTDWHTLTQSLSQTLKDHAPGWTDRNDADPGITMLEMLAFLAEGLLQQRGTVNGGSSAAARIFQALDAYEENEPIIVRVNGARWQRVETLEEAHPDAAVYTLDATTGTIAFGDGVHGRMPEHGSTLVIRYREASSAAPSVAITVRATWPLGDGQYHVSLRDNGTVQLAPCVTAARRWSGKKRVRFFTGQLLTADAFRAEQEYHLANHRRHLRLLHGCGVVSGLQVSGGGADGTSLTIQPGVAIDAHGREIVLGEAVAVTVPSDWTSASLIMVEYSERTVDPVPGLNSSIEASRIEEGCRVTLATAPCQSGVAVARLIRDAEGWRVDPAFVPLRPR